MNILHQATSWERPTASMSSMVQLRLHRLDFPAEPGMLWNARLCLANSEWHFFPVNQHLMQAGSTDYRYFPKIYSRQVLNSAPPDQTQAEIGEFYTRTTRSWGTTTAGRYVQMAGGSISHTIPLKSFRRSRPYRANTYLHNTMHRQHLSHQWQTMAWIWWTLMLRRLLHRAIFRQRAASW